MVDPQLWPYFTAFESEAALRGLELDLSLAGITGELVPIREYSLAVSCSNGGRYFTRETSIDSDFWDIADNADRGFILFHELGHCYLFRSHLEACQESGIWASLMRSGTLNSCRDLYNVRTRPYYLDELFEAGKN